MEIQRVRDIIDEINNGKITGQFFAIHQKFVAKNRHGRKEILLVKYIDIKNCEIFIEMKFSGRDYFEEINGINFGNFINYLEGRDFIPYDEKIYKKKKLNI